MKLETEITSPASYIPNANWFLEESKSAKWTPAENKMFENALAVYDKESPDRWQKVAAMIPGKTVIDVMRQYKELEVDVGKIEAGLVPVPGYSTSQFTLDWPNSHGYDGFRQSYGIGGKRSSSTRPAEQERKKGVPWTEEEHKLFLMGLKKYEKGDWRNISRNFVITRTPTPGLSMMPMLLPDGRIGYVLQSSIESTQLKHMHGAHTHAEFSNIKCSSAVVQKKKKIKFGQQHQSRHLHLDSSKSLIQSTESSSRKSVEFPPKGT